MITLFDVKAYVFTSDQHWVTPTALPPAPPRALYMMSWGTYHALVGQNPILQTNSIIVGGPGEADGPPHFPTMAAFGRDGDDLLDNPIRVLVTNDNMVDGLRDAFGFILGDLEVFGNPHLGTTLRNQEFEQVDERRWTSSLPAPVPLTRQTAIYTP